MLPIISSTITVLIAVARLELMFAVPNLAKMAVSEANKADSIA
jgi:hypothetical protein